MFPSPLTLIIQNKKIKKFRPAGVKLWVEGWGARPPSAPPLGHAPGYSLSRQQTALKMEDFNASFGGQLRLKDEGEG